MRRSSGKKRAPKTKMAKAMRKKPMRKKTTKKGKNPWLLHVDNVLKELRKKDPNAQRKQAMIEAKKTYKKGQPVSEVEDSWNVSSSKYSTVGKDSWNVSTSKYSTVGKKSKKKGKKKKGKKKKGKSRRRRRSRRRIGGSDSDAGLGLDLIDTKLQEIVDKEYPGVFGSIDTNKIKNDINYRRKVEETRTPGTPVRDIYSNYVVQVSVGSTIGMRDAKMTDFARDLLFGKVKWATKMKKYLEHVLQEKTHKDLYGGGNDDYSKCDGVTQ